MEELRAPKSVCCSSSDKQLRVVHHRNDLSTAGEEECARGMTKSGRLLGQVMQRQLGTDFAKYFVGVTNMGQGAGT